MHDIVIIGGGIVGLATAVALSDQRPGADIVVLDKEQRLAAHQTGNNSGVLHSGIYYPPGSMKARFCREGNAELVAFCRERGIPVDVCGKVIVATRTDELAGLERLHERAEANGITAERLGPEGIRDHEPHCRGIAGLWVPSTGIVDFVALCEAFATIVDERGGRIRRGVEVSGIRRQGGVQVLTTTEGEIRSRYLVNCAGLHSDRVARTAGTDPGARIVPFRGEYYELAPSARHLVKGLIYPVPDPAFPFLGVHFTRMIDGSVHAGPNAVLAFAREGYRKRDVNVRDSAEILSYRGFWRLARRHYRMGAAEMARSYSKQLFLRSLQRLVPEVRRRDLVPTHAGVRAQALTPDGGLVDDFLIVESEGALHVCNAPSPAATSSLEIGKAVAARVPSPSTV